MEKPEKQLKVKGQGAKETFEGWEGWDRTDRADRAGDNDIEAKAIG